MSDAACRQCKMIKILIHESNSFLFWACLVLQACGRMLPEDYETSVFTPEDGVAALHVAAMLIDASHSAAGHMVSIGAVALFLSR